MINNATYKLMIFENQDMNSYRGDIMNKSHPSDGGMRDAAYRIRVKDMTAQQIISLFNDNYRPRNRYRTSADPSGRRVFGTIGFPVELEFMSAKSLNEYEITINSEGVRPEELDIYMANQVVAIRRGADLHGNMVDFVYITKSIDDIELEALKKLRIPVTTHFITPGYEFDDEARHYAHEYFLELEPSLREHLRFLKEFEKLEKER